MRSGGLLFSAYAHNLLSYGIIYDHPAKIRKSTGVYINMLAFLKIFNISIGLIMALLYSYQIFYTGVALIDLLMRKKRSSSDAEAAFLHRYAVIIPARNESQVIGQLIDSLKRQRYPSNLIDIFVIADNCTDNTAQTAREAGATVFERFNTVHVGKGYALDFAFKEIFARHDRGYEAFVVFDADNLAHPDFFREMNRCFDAGSRIITSYRSCKNFGSSWVSSASALWYLRESRFLNAARAALHSSCLVSGTGFMAARDIFEKNSGWKHHLLTEDIEFSIDSVIEGEQVDFCETAVLYDEQPVRFSQFWTQRLRWAKGFYQVFSQYGIKLFQRLFHSPRTHRLSCYDLLMMILPAMPVTVLGLLVNLCALLGGLIISDSPIIHLAACTLFSTVANFCLLFFAYGALTLLCERRMLRGATAYQLIRCLLAFPLFMAAHIPMSVQALFCAVEWKPIAHTCVKTVGELHQ